MHHLILLLSLAAGPGPQTVYTQICDASTAVAVGSDRFLVSNDEQEDKKDKLWLYRIGQPAPAAPAFDISSHLALKGDAESDIEGSAMLNGTVYWITSHGRTKKGKLQTNRYQLFALTPKEAGKGIDLVPTGKPYTRLMEDMLARFPNLGLAPLTPAEDPNLAPEAPKGTNIEGLAAWKGDQLLIAFRNPIPGEKALLIPLENPTQVIEKGEKARFGEPIQLDLGGLGIRSIEHWEQQKIYLIAAGAFDDGPTFHLFSWSGDPAQPPTRLPHDLVGLRPEAIVVFPGRNEILLLSDDGGIKVNGTECKDLPKAQKSFRSRWVSLAKP